VIRNQIFTSETLKLFNYLVVSYSTLIFHVRYLKMNSLRSEIISDPKPLFIRKIFNINSLLSKIICDSKIIFLFRYLKYLRKYAILHV
jgi:hypothetical protein